MKNKIFSLFSLAILTLLVLTSFVSATVTSFSTNPTTLLNTSGVHTVIITATSDAVETAATFSATQLTHDGKIITFTNVTQALVIGANTINMLYTVQDGFNFEMKQYTTPLAVNNATTSIGSSSLTFTQTDFCAWDANGLTSSTADLKTTIKDIRVVSGFGKDNEWYPQDEVEVDVRVENNNNNDKIRNIVLEWGLFNENTGKWTIEVSDESDFDLKDGDEKIVTLKFKLDNMDEDIQDLDKGDFVFYARATGDVDEDTDRAVCSSNSDTASIFIESDFVITTDVQLPETNACGSQVQVTADVWNIGDSDQSDVYIVLYNKELGINQKVIIGDVDAFDNTKLDVLVNVPQNVEEKSYSLTISVYNEDSEVFQNSDDDYSKSEYALKVAGSCSNLPLASVAANLQSETTKAGQELIVKATVANTGSVQKTFGIELTGYEDWATLVSIDKTSLDLKSKATGDVLVTLKVNADASGEKTFNILVKDGTKILSQPVTATFEKSSIFSALTGLVTGITGTENNNMYLWGIGALNLVLVIVIIFVAVKVVKKKK